MQPSRARLTCRSKNPFSPSIALWQHFVLPNRPFSPPKRLSSTAEASKPETDLDAFPSPPEPSRNAEKESVAIKNRHARDQSLIRKVKDTKGLNAFSNPVHASIAKNQRAQSRLRQAGNATGNRLMRIAREAFAEQQDYDGVVVKPIQNDYPVRESQLPWTLKPEERPTSAHERLNAEIARFYEYARPTRNEELARRHLIEQIRMHVRDILPNHMLEVFGSERTGTALATSDIDLRLIKRNEPVNPHFAKLPPPPPKRKELMYDLYRLYHGGLAKNNAYLLANVRHARYPLISLQDRMSGLDVQIVLANDTSASRQLMQQYMTEYPYLQQVYSVIKTMFDIRGLSDVFRGGFGSYSIFMMLVASIRHKPSRQNDAAGTLINFLRFWRQFDTKTKGVSIEPTLLFDKSTEHVITPSAQVRIEEGQSIPLPEYMLTLRDPADETNDLGRKGVAIKHVQKTFNALSSALDEDLRVNTRHSLIAPLVGPVYALNRNRRYKLEQQGRRVQKVVQISLAKTAKQIREDDSVKEKVQQVTENPSVMRHDDTTPIEVYTPRVESQDKESLGTASKGDIALEPPPKEEEKPILDTKGEGP